MTYKISYNSKFVNGYHYDQTINCIMSKQELIELNCEITKVRKNCPSYDYMTNIFLRPFEIGVNATTLTQSHFFANYFGFHNDKRFKDRNTIVIINIK